MKFALVSTSLQQTTGYSKVAYNLLKQLRSVEGLELFQFAIHRKTMGMRPAIEGLVVEDHSDFDFDKLQGFLDKHSIDVVMIYNDIGVILSYMKKINHPRIWAYLDTIAHGIPPPLLKALGDGAEKIFLFNSYWKSVYNFKQSYVLEHGVDTDIFKVLPKDKTVQVREQLKIPKDAIVFFNANRNSRRKRLDLTISAFIQFRKRNPSKNAMLLLMCGMEGYYNVPAIIQDEIQRWNAPDCSGKIMQIDTLKHLFTDESMNEFYNITDYGLNTSVGEGYGLTAIEHLTIGKPQIITHLPQYESFLSARDVVFVKPFDREYAETTDFTAGHFPIFSSTHICEAMEIALKKKVNYSPKSWTSVCKNFLDLVSYEMKNDYKNHHQSIHNSLRTIEDQVNIPSIP